ncbi:MAG: RpiB/LacA/LacB family sugar-phosphate isomerase [Candidatus Yonathbacteria bacterium]|nr:RpiB/LacA/LacB family sugar-phosphate isomerase [Candidatus Yonathbacteria bacterium]
MRIFIGSDHAGFELKQKLIPFVESLGHEVVDKGAFALDEHDDYPDFVVPVAEEVAKDSSSRGIILGGSGQGEAIAANRVKGARAAVFYGGPLDIVELSREHNDANILSLGARFVVEGEAETAVQLWLETEFSGDERHARRIKKIDEKQ